MRSDIRYDEIILSIPESDAERRAYEIKNFLERKINQNKFCPYSLKIKLGKTLGSLNQI